MTSIPVVSRDYTYQVATIPPAVPRVTTYAVEIERIAGPPALFAAHARKPGPPGKAPMVSRNMPPYLTLGSVAHRITAKPAIVGTAKMAMYMPRRLVLSETKAIAMATMAAQT